MFTACAISTGGFTFALKAVTVKSVAQLHSVVFSTRFPQWVCSCMATGNHSRTSPAAHRPKSSTISAKTRPARCAGASVPVHYIGVASICFRAIALLKSFRLTDGWWAVPSPSNAAAAYEEETLASIGGTGGCSFVCALRSVGAVVGLL